MTISKSKLKQDRRQRTEGMIVVEAVAVEAVVVGSYVAEKCW